MPVVAFSFSGAKRSKSAALIPKNIKLSLCVPILMTFMIDRGHVFEHYLASEPGSRRLPLACK